MLKMFYDGIASLKQFFNRRLTKKKEKEREEERKG